MKEEHLKIYWKDIPIGSLLEPKEDFPSFNGKFKSQGSDIPKEVSEYIEYWKSVDKLQIQGKEESAEYKKLVEDYASKYEKNIELDPWHLIDSQGEKVIIEAPVFFKNDTVSWRPRN